MLILSTSYSKGDLNTQGNGLLSNRKIGYVEKKKPEKTADIFATPSLFSPRNDVW